MKTPAGTECKYFYGDYYRGRNHEECRLLGAAWTIDCLGLFTKTVAAPAAVPEAAAAPVEPPPAAPAASPAKPRQAAPSPAKPAPAALDEDAPDEGGRKDLF